MLKIHGLNNVFMTQLIVVGICMQCMIFLILNSIFIVMCPSMFTFSLMDAFLFNVIFVIVLLLSVYIMIYKNTKQLSIERILRY